MIFVFWTLSFKLNFSLFSFTFIKLRQHITKQRHHFADKGLYGQSYGFSSSHVWMWELDNKEGWAPKNWCFQIVVLEKTPEGPLDSKEIKPVKPKGNQCWIFIGRAEDEAEVSILWAPAVKSRLIGKDLDAGKDWGQKEKRETEDEMVRWHHRFNGHGLRQTSGDGERRKPGVLQSVGSQRVRHDMVSKQQQYVPQPPYPFIHWWTSRLLLS